jgi:hypothetical protein
MGYTLENLKYGGFMKKTLLMAFIGLILVGFVLAQQGWGSNPGIPPQTVTVTGTLQLKDGTIAIVNNSQVYYVPSLERYIGFLDGLKEGTQVTLDGYVYNNPSYTYLQPSKLTMNGKSYDLQPNTFVQGNYNGYGRNYNRGRGGWCCW